MTLISHYKSSIPLSNIQIQLLLRFYRAFGLPTTDTFNFLYQNHQGLTTLFVQEKSPNFLTRVPEEFPSSTQPEFSYINRILNGPLLTRSINPQAREYPIEALRILLTPKYLRALQQVLTKIFLPSFAQQYNSQTIRVQP